MRSLMLLLLGGLIFIPVLAVYSQQPPEEALPPGALQRLGSLRLRYDYLNDAQYLPDGRVLALTGRTLDILDMTTGLRQEQRTLPLAAVSLAVSAEGQRLLLAGSNGDVCLYDIASGTEIRRWPTQQASLRRALFAPEGKRVLTIGRLPPTLKEWDLETGRELIAITGRLKYYDAAAYIGDGRRAIAGGGYYGLEVWDLQTGALLQTLKSDYCAYDIIASSDGKRVLIGERTRASEWDMERFQLLKEFRGHPGGAVTGQAYGAHPDEIFTGSRDGSLRRWNRLEAKVLLRWTPHAAYARMLRLSPDGRWLLSYSPGYYLVESDIATGKPRLPFERHQASVEAVAWTPDGKIMSGSLDGTARLWDPISGRCLATMSAGLGASCVATSPKGQRLCVGDKDSLIREYDVTGKLLRELKGHFGYVRALAYLPDGRLASSADDGTIRLWGAGTEPEAIWTGHRGGVLSLALPDDKHLASAGRDGTVRVWEIASGKLLWSRVEHRGYVTCLARGKDGEFYSAGRDGRILRWHSVLGLQPGEMSAGAWIKALTVAERPEGTGIFVGTEAPDIFAGQAGQKLSPLYRGHKGAINALAVSPDGVKLVSASADGTLLVWPAPMSQ